MSGEEQVERQTEDSGLERQRAIRKFWFDGLTTQQQDGTIRPLFEKANPTSDSVRKVSEAYDEF